MCPVGMPILEDVVHLGIRAFQEIIGLLAVLADDG